MITLSQAFGYGALVEIISTAGMVLEFRRLPISATSIASVRKPLLPGMDEAMDSEQELSDNSQKVIRTPTTVKHNGESISWADLPKHIYSDRNKLFLRSLTQKSKLPAALNPTEGLLELAHKLRVAEKEMYGNRDDAVAGLLPISVLHPVLGMSNGVALTSPVDKEGTEGECVLKDKSCSTVPAVDVTQHASVPRSVKKPTLWSVLIGAKGSENVDIEDEPFAKYMSQSEDLNGEANELAKPLTEVEMEAIVSSAINCVLDVRCRKDPVKCTTERNPGLQSTTGRPDAHLPNDILMPSPDSLTVAGLIRKFKCSLCTYETDNKSHLRRHQSSVHGINIPYQCYICKRDFARSEKIRHHFQRVHPNVDYNEKLCRKSNFSQLDEGTPVVKVDNNTDWNDSTVNSVMGGDDGSEDDNADIMDSTDDTVKAVKVEGNSNLALKCTHCSYVGRDIWGLKRHTIDRHSDRKPFHCTECTYSTSRRHRMINHLKSHDRLVCMYCKGVCEDFPSFRAHLKVCCAEETARKLTCQICRVTLPNKKLLVEHKAKYHNINVLSCDLCLFTSEDQQELEDHLVEHNVSSVTCEFCSKDFRSTPQLECHLKSCHGMTQQQQNSLAQPCPPQPVMTKKELQPRKMPQDPLLRCSKCEFETTYASVMRSHEETHGEVKKCGYGGCTFSTTQDKLLELHRNKSHKEEHMVQKMYNTKGRYSCPLCMDRSPFRYRRSYEKHMERCHSMDEKCPLCEQRFYTFEALKQHITVAHDAEVEEVSDSDEEGVDTSSVDTTTSSQKPPPSSDNIIATPTSPSPPQPCVVNTSTTTISCQASTSAASNTPFVKLVSDTLSSPTQTSSLSGYVTRTSSLVVNGEAAIDTDDVVPIPTIGEPEQCTDSVNISDHCYAAA